MDVGKAQRPLTEARAKMLDAILAHIAETTWPPTVREIGARVGNSSTNAVCEQLARLERDGLLVRRKGAARAMRVTELGHELLAAFRAPSRTA